MMISPETYYEEYLKGKSPKEIKGCIRSLKIKMNKLKKIIESPDYFEELKPSELTRFKCMRSYLNRAIQALEDLGEAYTYTKTELMTKEINDNLPFLSEVTFYYGKMEENSGLYTYYLNDDVPERKIHYKNMVVRDFIDQEELIEGLASLNIGEWKRKYGKNDDAYAMRWHIILEFNNGYNTLTYGGVEAFPYNFEDVLQVLDVDLGLEEELNNATNKDEITIYHLLERIVFKLKELPVGTKISTEELLDLSTKQHAYTYGSYLYDGLEVGLGEMYEIDELLKRFAHAFGIKIDDTILDDQPTFKFKQKFLVTENLPLEE